MLREHSKIEGIFNIGNDVVVFISNLVANKTPALHRIIIDGNTGDLKKEEEIGRLKQFTMADGFALMGGGVPLPRFVIRKDADSDNYGVVLFNSLVSERSKRIELLHFNSDHQQISRAFYVSPNEEFKYMELIDFVVLG